MNQPITKLARAFRAEFDGAPPTVCVRAPGRVNLIGEHTDYNDGLVLPVAIALDLHVAAGPRDDGRVHAYSRNLDQRVDFDPCDPPPGPIRDWSAHVLGVAALLAERGIARCGANLYIDSDIPIGAGLSSSAAVEAATGLALCVIAGSPIDPSRLADVCRESEHRFADTPCGIMDQYACLFCRTGHALLLDCRSRAIEHVPLPEDALRLCVIDTQVRRQMAAGRYAERVQECRAAVEQLRTIRPEIRTLRDARPDDVRTAADRMDATLRARACHVIEENERVRAFAEALRNRNLTR
ncbi:MAG: galactokinase family protein, partial [Phycisphaerae bacterium]